MIKWIIVIIIIIIIVMKIKGDYVQIAMLDPFLNGTTSQYGFTTGGNDFLLAVGAHRYPNSTISMGAVFLYYRSNYSLAQVLYGQSQSQFGWLTRVNGNRMAVAAPLLNDSVGAVYIYDISSVH